MKRFIAIMLAGTLLLAAGCITDNSNDNNKKDTATKISQLSMGGVLIYDGQAGYGIAAFGTLYGSDPFENARIFVNGVELQNNMGIFQNAQPLTPDIIDTGKPVHIAVYALGDSVIKSIALPQTPVIVLPAENAQLSVGDSLTVEINYPGAHQFISMAMDNQNNVAMALESNAGKMTIPIPGANITTPGATNLYAISFNASGPIPKDIDINKQYSVFLVGSAASRIVNFVQK